MNGPLVGRRILVVEDEYFLAFEVEAILSDAGAEIVGPCPNLASALEQASAGDFDLAVLDVDLHGELVYPVADVLVLRDKPFLFATAFAGSALPERFRDHARVEKPFGARHLLDALSLLRRRSGRDPRQPGEPAHAAG